MSGSSGRSGRDRHRREPQGWSRATRSGPWPPRVRRWRWSRAPGRQWDERLPGTIGETVAAIEEAGGRAVAIQADLLEREDVPRLVTEARGRARADHRPGQQRRVHRSRPSAQPDAAPDPQTGLRRRPPDRPVRQKAANADWPGFLSVPLSAYRRHFEIGVFASTS